MKYTSTTYKAVIFGLLFITACIVSAEKSVLTDRSASDSEQNLISNIYTSLYDAIETDRAYEVKKFIEFGANINHRYENAKTPLMLASGMGSIGVVKVLLELGADHNLTSEDNLTAMDYAIKNNNKFIVAVLETNLNTNAPKESSTTQNLESVDTIDKKDEVEVSIIQKPKVANLPPSASDSSSSVIATEIGGYPNIVGTYNAKTTAIFSQCGDYDQTIEYFAEESIGKINKSGKFNIHYSAPLLKCKGKGKFTDNKQNITGTYNCNYKTENGLQGTLFMSFQGTLQGNKIDMNYKGRDTTPGIRCKYDWERIIVLNN